ncbi:MAG: hypothetical protein RKU31_00120 [Deltaproteobacteria bacterium]
MIDLEGAPLYWHVPPSRTAVTLPDSRALWDVLWEHRDRVAGFAHSHPGSGVPAPSHEDVTTFSALERGLGRRYDWWIATRDGFVVCRWSGPGPLDYRTERCDAEPTWVSRLRALSEEEE